MLDPTSKTADKLPEDPPRPQPLPPAPPASDQSIEFEFSVSNIQFRFKGPSHRAAQSIQHGFQQSLNGLLNTQRVVLAEPEALPALPAAYVVDTPPAAPP